MREESIVAHLMRRAEDCRARSQAATSAKHRAIWDELAEQFDLRVRQFKTKPASRAKAERPNHPAP